MNFRGWQSPLQIFALSTALILVSSSCMKKPNLSSDDGPEVPPEAVQQALIDTWGSADLFDIKVNEFSYTEKSMTLAQLPPRVLLQDGKTVQSMSDSATERTYTILQQLAEISEDNQQKLSTTTLPITIKKSNLADSPATSDTGTSKIATPPNADVTKIARALITDDLQAEGGATPFLPINLNLMKSLLFLCVKGDGWDVSCHNMTANTVKEPAPPQIARQTNCADLPDCQITKRVVSFDLLVTYKEAKDNSTVTSRARYTVKVSPQLPYLSRLTDFCYEGLASYQNQKYPVKVCQSIRNFVRGDTPTPP